MWMYSIDLKDKHFHFSVHPKYMSFLQVSFKGQLYQFRALPFGLSSAPWLFDMVTMKFTEHCKELGWNVNPEKSELIPQQVFAFVGIHCDLIFFTAHPLSRIGIKVT